MTIINRSFFTRPTLTVAQALLGQYVVRELDGQRLTGRIVETEAYIGADDSANHASKGRTGRTRVMFGPAGRAYVYLIYGMYYMLNVVTEAPDFPAAVLIRAVEPVEGINLMQIHRPRVKKTVNLTNGPGKLCQALAIDQQLNNWDLTLGQKLWLESGRTLPDQAIATGPRIGIGYAHPEDQAALWRFRVKDNRFVST